MTRSMFNRDAKNLRQGLERRSFSTLRWAPQNDGGAVAKSGGGADCGDELAEQLAVDKSRGIAQKEAPEASGGAVQSNKAHLVGIDFASRVCFVAVGQRCVFGRF